MYRRAVPFPPAKSVGKSIAQITRLPESESPPELPS
jgi:hypothetical protein